MSERQIIRDGETYSHIELGSLFGLNTERAVKDFIWKFSIPYVAIKGRWWVEGEAVRQALRSSATTHDERRAERDKVR
jgi:hypothetical protein